MEIGDQFTKQMMIIICLTDSLSLFLCFTLFVSLSFLFLVYFPSESEVIGVTLSESWGELLPSGESTEIGGEGGRGGSSDRLEGSGLGGGLISLIVILVLVALLAGIALFIFIWNKKGYITIHCITNTLEFLDKYLHTTHHDEDDDGAMSKLIIFSGFCFLLWWKEK